jgi:hypothetical protein
MMTKTPKKTVLYAILRQKGDYLAGSDEWTADVRDALQFSHYVSAFNVARKFGGQGSRVIEVWN